MWKFIEDWIQRRTQRYNNFDESGVLLLVATHLGQMLPWDGDIHDPKDIVPQIDSYGYHSHIPNATQSFCLRPRFAPAPAIQLIAYGRRPLFDAQIYPLMVNYPDNTAPKEVIFRSVPVLWPNIAVTPEFNPIALKLYLDSVMSGTSPVDITIRYRDVDTVKRTVAKVQIGHMPLGIRVLSQETCND